MQAHDRRGRWTLVFYAAALFNYAIGFPILLARRWTYDLAYVSEVTRDPMALRFWSDFGFGVVLIGVGYHLLARDVSKNRGIVLLGIFAKLFDVFNLTTLYLWGLAKPLVLVPALIDAAFVVLFVAFWISTARSLKQSVWTL
ncbi:MAG TPA: hypothetical protein VK363_05650 [Pyrinomonadaceae bacterium]|nr:hypothetical protein [Pyrinomonadaceae bacterium]